MLRIACFTPMFVCCRTWSVYNGTQDDSYELLWRSMQCAANQLISVPAHRTHEICSFSKWQNLFTQLSFVCDCSLDKPHARTLTIETASPFLIINLDDIFSSLAVGRRNERKLKQLWLLLFVLKETHVQLYFIRRTLCACGLNWQFSFVNTHNNQVFLLLIDA